MFNKNLLFTTTGIAFSLVHGFILFLAGLKIPFLMTVIMIVDFPTLLLSIKHQAFLFDLHVGRFILLSSLFWFF